MASANIEGCRLVRCPKCLSILPEPANVTVYKCGECGTTLRAKIRASNGLSVAKKQVRQDSDNFSIATSVSNGVPPQNKDQVSSGAAIDSSFVADVPSTERDCNGTLSYENGDGTPAEKIAMEVGNTESKDYHNFEDQTANSKLEGPADPDRRKASDTSADLLQEAESHAVEECAENPETLRVREDDDTDRRLMNASDNNMLYSDEKSKAAAGVQDHEQKEDGETGYAENKKSYLVRAQSRSCDLRASGNSLDFHSARTSLQSKSFRAGEPLQSKIMNTVDELKDDLSELFSKPQDPKPKAHAHPPPPPRPSKQDRRVPRVPITSSAPLTAYHPASKHSGYASRVSRSGHVAAAPRGGLPSPRHRRHRVHPCHHHGLQMEMRPCRHECCQCHSCQPPPCYRPYKQELKFATAHEAPVKEIRRRTLPRHHCRPVLRGAPFVVCSSCLELVQLPTDFAVPSRGTRRLQCGSCSGVLSYSYRDPGRKKLQSPFGGDEYSTDDYEIHVHQAGHQGDPVSYSEEYGLSFGIGIGNGNTTSTEEEGQPLYVSRSSSFNTIDGAVAGDGKLHRLMGYSSASELLRHSPDLFESFDGRTPMASAYDRKGKGVCGAAEGDSGEGERDSAATKRSKAPRTRSGGLPLHGILKKGIHGLESLKRRS